MKHGIFAYAFLLSIGVSNLSAQSKNTASPSEKSDLFMPLSLQPLVTKVEGSKEEVQTIVKDGIPFSVIDKGASLLSLSEAGWPEQKEDPSDFYENYDDATKYVGNRSLPLVEIPRGDYTAAYLLGWADSNDATSNRVTLRIGPRAGFGGRANTQVWMKDFTGTVPRGTEKSLVVTRIPITEALAQDVRKEVMSMEITKEIRLALRTPDPNRFRWRPLGLPSGVKVAAITLERSPIQMEVKATTSGALFVIPSQPEFIAKLQNITGKDQKFTLSLNMPDGKKQAVEGVIPAGKSVEQTIKLTDIGVGYHPVTITLDGGGKPLLSRTTAFGVVPKCERPYRNENPWGTWTFGGAHGTPSDDDQVGELFKKLGLRYGMFGASSEMRAKYGVLPGVEPAMKRWEPEKVLSVYNGQIASQPDTLRHLLIFHEDAISGAHATRVPDLFVDRPPYVMDDAEKKRFSEMTDRATKTAQLFRKEHPEVKLQLGNGGPGLREEFYRNKYPTELFDTAGNESASFMRPPETQPPDIVANNATLWMDRQMLDAYGYEDKAISQCLEITYPNTNPGNLSLQTQADYFIRNILHSMAWHIPQIRIGTIVDVGNSYRYSNWGSSGFFTRMPDSVPKPAALAIATLTCVLDGARFENYIETGSDSAYLMQFRKKDNSLVLACWVLRGSRDYTLEIDSAPDIRQVQETGPARDLKMEGGKVTVTATSSPAYLELPRGASLKNVTLGLPMYASKPEGEVSKLNALDSLEGWKIEETRNPLLEFYNPIQPRRLGDFSFEKVSEFEGKGPALRIAAKPVPGGKPTMPMYVELIHEKGIPLPGKPTDIGLWVNGNSGWGRIIYELEDASGQKWISIGAKAEGNSRWMADWLTPEMQKKFKPGEQADWNTDDVFGLSRINFDGWRYLSFPLPGHYPGGYHWPFNSQWHWDKDGSVHYPLTLKKIIVQLPEKLLYLTRFEPAKRPDIYLRELISTQREIDQPKTLPDEYVEKVQVTVD